MELGHMFEALMLVCFGFSWPLNVIKAYKARTAKGTSLAFILLIITGYVAGITAKFMNHQINYVLAVYFLNLAIVMCNVFVFIRNVELDKRNQGVVTKKKISELQKKYKNTNYTYSSEENMNYQELNKIAKTNGVVLMGGKSDKEIPVTELAQSFEFDFGLYNRSDEKLSIRNAKEYFAENVAPIFPEAMILHIGEEDAAWFKANPSEFDKCYLDLIFAIKSLNKNVRLAMVSISNPLKDDAVSNMNLHIKAIADSSKCPFINLEEAKLWNPKATKAANDFAYSMGLRTKKPIMNVAEIIYSYACLETDAEELEEVLVG